MMIINYPTFFKTRPSIKLQDPLQKFLGTFQDGIVEFSYLEVVKNAGHSCPDVTGAYLMTLKALKALYKDELAVRGEIKASFKGSIKFERVDTGEMVIANYDLSSIPIDPKQDELMSKILNEEATVSEEIDFEVLWQHRVEKIFNHVSEVVEVVKV